MLHRFTARLGIIGINPFVFVPPAILKELFIASGKEKGHIPVGGYINDRQYRQTLLRYKGEWRLYINTTMLKDSPKRIGEEIHIAIGYDPAPRLIPPHPLLKKALRANPQANAAFKKLSPSRQQEMIRYISLLKSEAGIAGNVEKLVGFLLGKNAFLGRSMPDQA